MVVGEGQGGKGRGEVHGFPFLLTHEPVWCKGNLGGNSVGGRSGWFRKGFLINKWYG